MYRWLVEMRRHGIPRSVGVIPPRLRARQRAKAPVRIQALAPLQGPLLMPSCAVDVTGPALARHCRSTVFHHLRAIHERYLAPSLSGLGPSMPFSAEAAHTRLIESSLRTPRFGHHSAGNSWPPEPGGLHLWVQAPRAQTSTLQTTATRCAASAP